MHCGVLPTYRKLEAQPYQELASFRLTDDPRELVFDGPCGPVSLQRRNTENHLYFDIVSTRKDFVGSVDLSVYQGEAIIDGVSCLLTRAFSSGTIEALIIVPVDGQSGKYLRIGSATVQHSIWAAALPREQVVLI